MTPPHIIAILFASLTAATAASLLLAVSMGTR